MIADFVSFYLMPGIVLGCIYALGAVGLTMLFGILRFAHFAHGDVMTVGAYVAFVGVGLGLSAYQSIPLAMLVCAVLVLAVDRAFYRPLRRASPIVLLISGFGVALMLRAAILFFFGPDGGVYEQGIRRPMVFPTEWGRFRIQERHLWIIGGAVLIALALHLFLTRTRLGKAMRAMSDNPDLARITGIPTERVIAITWAIGAATAATAGVFLAIDTQFNPLMGMNMLLPIFAAMILGGVGRPWGAVFGGVVLGIAEELVAAPIWGGEPLISPAYKVGLSFAVMVVLLIFRPTGLFKGQS